VRTAIAIPLALFAGCAAPPPDSPPRQPAELVGRTAGTPLACVRTEPSSSLRISENNRHVLVYGSGRTIWANHLGGCGFGQNDILVIEPTGSQYCRGDLVHSIDRYSKIPGPTCALMDFVPYTRP
jgi:hypothetical protein